VIFSDKYLPLWTKEYRYAIISGGRGSAKSFTVQTFLSNLTYQPRHKIALTRYTMNSAEKSVIPEFEEKLILQDVEQDFQLTGKTYKNLKSKSELYFMGLKTSSGVQTASLKSINGLTTWSMEEAEELVDDGNDVEACTFDKIDDSIRQKGLDLRTILTWNPSDEDSFVYKRFFKSRGVDIKFNGLIGDTLYIYTTYEDNLDNLHPSFIKKAEEIRLTNPARHDHIYKGIPRKENAFALWRMMTMISPHRVQDLPDFKRVIVAVDPSVEDTGRQDECGIVVVAEDFHGHYYLLKDLSELLGPEEWAATAVGAYNDFACDNIIAEKNQGGQLVTINIRVCKKNVPVKLVHASKGKLARAEPVASLYSAGRVHHVGNFAELEDELCTYTGNPKGKSPNRLDAIVWGLTELAGLEMHEEASLFIGGV
jgi:PBSX family phage terminase large subunit